MLDQKITKLASKISVEMNGGDDVYPPHFAIWEACSRHGYNDAVVGGVKQVDFDQKAVERWWESVEEGPISVALPGLSWAVVWEGDFSFRYVQTEKVQAA